VTHKQLSLWQISVLLGNANNQISEARRENALECVHPSLRKYGKCEFKDAEGDLFGDSFKEVLVKKVEADSALSKAVHIVTRSASVKTYQNPKGRWRGNSQFFSEGPDRPVWGWVRQKPPSVPTTVIQLQGEREIPPQKAVHKKRKCFQPTQPREQAAKGDRPTRLKQPPAGQAGKLRHHLHSWEEITQDQWALEFNLICGLELQ